MVFYELLFYVSLCSISAVYASKAESVELVAEFNSPQINGTVLFTQNGVGKVNISVKELNLESGQKLSIHEFPVKYEGHMMDICKSEKIGGIFGNLSERFDFTQDTIVNSNLSLSGKNSIFGRSLRVLDQNNSIVGCSTIKRKASSSKIVVGVFRAVSPGIAGTIVLTQSEDNPDSDTAVDINLMLVDARSEPMKGLSLAVYKSASTSDVEGSCEGVEEIFNPLEKTSCDNRKHSTCLIGDLSGKLGQLEVPLPGEGKSHTFQIDTNLPLSGENSVVGKSLVILSNGKPLICAKIQEYQTMAAEVVLDNDQGLSGTIGFTQGSLYEPVMVNVTVSGGYDGITVHESCNASKFGNGLAINQGSGAMDELTMYGQSNVMFQGLTVNKTGSSQRSSCMQIKPKDVKYHLKAKVQFNETNKDGVTGSINFEQVVFDTSNAFAYSSLIVMDVWYKNNSSKVTRDHNWHVHISPIGSDSKMAVGKKCMSCLGHYNPYKVYEPDNNYRSTCNPNNPFRCELGDLSNKLTTYDIGGGRKQFSENENYLASWHNIIGRSVVIHVKNKGAARLVCEDIVPQDESSGYNMETLNVKNSSKTRDTESFRQVVSEALSIDAWRVADVKFEDMKGNKECLTYKFLLIDDSKSNLHQTFADLVEDDSEKLKEFVPSCGDDKSGWKINKGNTAEVVGIVFGIIILIVFIICMIVWLRKRRQEHEDSSKLVQNVEAAASTNQTVANTENNDNPPPANSKKEWDVTTSL